MEIISLLGQLHDEVWLRSNNKIVMDNNNVGVIILSSNLIKKFIIPVCEDVIGEKISIIKKGKWHKALLMFGRNQYNNRPELQSVTLESAYGDSYTCNMKDRILTILASDEKDELYFSLCKEIFFEILM